MSKQDIDPRVLEPIDEGKRSSLRKIIVGTAFVTPVVTSFPISGMKVAEAQTYSSNLPS